MPIGFSEGCLLSWPANSNTSDLVFMVSLFLVATVFPLQRAEKVLNERRKSSVSTHFTGLLHRHL